MLIVSWFLFILLNIKTVKCCQSFPNYSYGIHSLVDRQLKPTLSKENYEKTVNKLKMLPYLFRRYQQMMIDQHMTNKKRETINNIRQTAYFQKIRLKLLENCVIH